MSYSSPAPSGYQIDIVDQVGRAYRIVFDRMQLVLEMALLPFIVVLAIQLLARLLSGATLALTMAGMMAGGIIGFGLSLIMVLIAPAVMFVVSSVFFVRWHRFVLLGESVSGDLIPPGWAEFVIAGLKVGGLFLLGWIVLVVIAILPPHAITFPLSIFGSIALGFLFLRVALIFPAAAIERPVPLRTAWDWIEGNYWRLFVCAICCYVPFLIVEIVIVRIGALFPSLFWIVFAALELAVSFVGAAVVAAMLSHIYIAIAARGLQATE